MIHAGIVIHVASHERIYKVSMEEIADLLQQDLLPNGLNLNLLNGQFIVRVRCDLPHDAVLLHWADRNFQLLGRVCNCETF